MRRILFIFENEASSLHVYTQRANLLRLDFSRLFSGWFRLM